MQTKFLFLENISNNYKTDSSSCQHVAFTLEIKTLFIKNCYKLLIISINISPFFVNFLFSQYSHVYPQCCKRYKPDDS